MTELHSSDFSLFRSRSISAPLVLRNRTHVFCGWACAGGFKSPLVWNGIVSDIKETSPKKQRDEACGARPHRAAGLGLREGVTIPTFPRLNEAPSALSQGPVVTFLVGLAPVFLHFCVREGKRAKRMQEMRQYKRRHAMAAIGDAPASHYCSQHPPIIVVSCNKNHSLNTKREAQSTCKLLRHAEGAGNCPQARCGLPGWRSTVYAGAPSRGIPTCLSVAGCGGGVGGSCVGGAVHTYGSEEGSCEERQWSVKAQPAARGGSAEDSSGD